MDDISKVINENMKVPQKDGVVSMFWIDAHEEQNLNNGEIYLFGKVWIPEAKRFVSCSLIVGGLERVAYVLPKMSDERPLKERLASIYEELEKLRSKKFSYIKKWMCKLVKRQYAFELPIPHGEGEYMKIKYSAAYPPLPSNLKGETFDHIFGVNTSMLELFLVKRKIKGPCWLTIKNAKTDIAFKNTWSKLEIRVDNFKDIEVTVDDLNRESPPLVTMNIAMKTTKHEKNNTNEIAMISCIVHDGINIDGPTTDPKKKYKYFSLFRKLDKIPFPYDLNEQLRKSKSNA
jgi:DNA polymerase alpha subunit A